MNSDNKQPTRMFAAQLRRTVRREFTKLADLQIEAASESEARAIAARMAAGEDEEIMWVDGGDVDDDPEDATVDWVGEAKDGDAGAAAESRASRDIRVMATVDEILEANEHSRIERSRVIEAVERELDAMAGDGGGVARGGEDEADIVDRGKERIAR